MSSEFPGGQHVQRDDCANTDHEGARDERLRFPLGAQFFFGGVMSHRATMP